MGITPIPYIPAKAGTQVLAVSAAGTVFRSCENLVIPEAPLALSGTVAGAEEEEIGHEWSPVSRAGYRSVQCGLVSSTRANFHDLSQRLIRFSRRMA